MPVSKLVARDVRIFVLSSAVSLMLFRVFTDSIARKQSEFFRRAPTAPGIVRGYFDSYVRGPNKRQVKSRSNSICRTQIPSSDDISRRRFFNVPESEWQLSRFVMYHNLARVLLLRWENHAGGYLSVLDFSDSHFLESFNYGLNITRTLFPKVDVHRTPFQAESFDVVFADQVIEHVAFPHLALLEIRRILKHTGIAVITTVAYNPIHPAPSDFWRFTVNGLLALSTPFSQVVHCGSWGNADAISARAKLKMGSSAETKLYERKFSELAKRNELNNPFATWIVLQK